MNIDTWRDPYDAGFSPTRPRHIELHPGLTVLVGCNGAGKSTLLMNIREYADHNKIPCHLYDNLKDGGRNAFGSILGGFGEAGDDVSVAFALAQSSEGEAIKMNISRQSRLYKQFITSGKYKNNSYRLREIFSYERDNPSNDKRRILLFDAVDSGLSVDSIVELKVLFQDVLTYGAEQGIELYMIIAANEYELARNADCFDVNTGKYIRFRNYEAYRRFILKSRERKEKRIIKQEEFYQKRAEKEKKEAIEFIERSQKEIDKLKAKLKEHPGGYNEYRVKDLEREIQKTREKYQISGAQE